MTLTRRHLLGTLAAISVVGLAWLGGYELGQANGISAEREAELLKLGDARV